MFRSSARDSPERSVSISDAVDHRARDERAAEHRPRANEHDFPTGEVAQRAKHGARDGASRRPPLDRDHVALRPGGEALDVHALGDDAVVAGKALPGGRRGALGRREQRVDAVEQPLALRLAGRIGEALRREERRDRERLRVAKGEVREARQPRLDPVDDVVPPFAEREVEVETSADRHAHLRAARDRHRRPDGDQLGVGAALQDLPPGRELAGAIRRGENGDVVPERSQLPGDPVDVLVDGVRLRPGEGRDEADSEAHEAPESSPAPLDRLDRFARALVLLDEALDRVARLVVLDLLRRRLHQVGARAFERAGDAVVQRELREPDRIDHDPRGVRRVPDLELELDVERHVAEARALHADVRPLAVGQPRHVVGRADVDVLLAEVVVEHRRDRVRLRDLLRLEALALEHVQEVGVAADVQLHRLVELDAAVLEERREHAVRDRRADLRLDVVADDRHPGLLEPALPVRLAADEDRHAVDHRATCLEDLLGVPLRSRLRADGEVVDDHVGLRLLEDPDHVVGLSRRLVDDLGEELADPVVRHPARDLDPGLGDVGELDRVVRVSPDRVREVLADLRRRDVERRGELDVADVVAAEVDVHQAGDELIGVGVAVVLDALQERVRAVADADDRDADLVVAGSHLGHSSVGISHDCYIAYMR